MNQDRASIREDIERRLAALPDSNDLVDDCQHLGGCYRELGDLERAEYWYFLALSADPHDPWSKLYLGNIAFARHNNEQALDWFFEALDEMPGESIVHACLGDIYDAIGDSRRALRYYKSAHALNPESDYAYARLERWYRREYEPGRKNSPRRHKPAKRRRVRRMHPE